MLGDGLVDAASTINGIDALVADEWDVAVGVGYTVLGKERSAADSCLD